MYVVFLQFNSNSLMEAPCIWGVLNIFFFLLNGFMKNSKEFLDCDPSHHLGSKVPPVSEITSTVTPKSVPFYKL